MVYTVTRCVEIVKEDKASVWRELFVGFIACIPFLTHGIETTSLTSSPHAGHFITSDGVPWSTTALVVATGVSAPLFCVCVDRLGRRSGVFIVNLIQGASLIPLFLLNSTNTIVLHALAGASAAGLFTVFPAYIVEITSPVVRGPCLLLMMVMTTTGYMTRLFLDLEARMFLMTALVVMQTVLMLGIVETPSFLMMRGKEQRSKKVLSRLKCLPEDSPKLTKQLTDLRDESERAKSRGKITLNSFYKNKIWWDAFKIGILLYTTMVLCGSILFLDQKKTLAQLPVEYDQDSILVLTGMLVGSICGFGGAIFFDRKYILTFGYIAMALSSGVLAVYTQADLTVTSLQWVPLVSLAILVFAYGMSWALPVFIVAEMFNFEIRATILGFMFLYAQVIKLAHVHTFKYLEDYVGIYTLFYIFASVNLYGAVYTLFAVPCVRNRSLKQIEKALKRIPLPA